MISLMVETTTGLETLGTSVAFMLEQFTSMSLKLLTTPLFLIGVSIFVVGAVIGLVHRITKG